MKRALERAAKKKRNAFSLDGSDNKGKKKAPKDGAMLDGSDGKKKARKDGAMLDGSDNNGKTKALKDGVKPPSKKPRLE